MISDKKIAAFDLDGTLTESKQQLQPDMVSLLAQLTTKVKVAIISGGSIDQYKKQILPSFTSVMDLGVVDDIFSNLILLPTSGSRKYEYDRITKNWILTDEESFPLAVKAKVLKALRDILTTGEFDIPKKIYGEYIDERGTQITFSALGQEAPVEVKRDWDPNQEKRKKIKVKLEEMLPEVDIAIGGMTSIDILPKGFNKAKALEHLIEKSNINKDELIFVGNAVFPGGNDYAPYEAGIETVSVKNPADTANLIKGWVTT